MVDKTSKLWDCKDVNSTFGEGLYDIKFCGLKFLGIGHGGQCGQCQACKGIHPENEHRV